MNDKFFESVGVSEDLLFAGGGTVNLVHQIGDKVEAGFLVHLMLSRFLNKFTKEADKARVLLVLNHHSKVHWLSIGSKLGLNMASLEETGALMIIDLMKESFQNLTSNPEGNCGQECLQSLYSRCEKHILELKSAGCRRVLVVVEDLSNFLDSRSNHFQSSERDLVNFLVKLRALSVHEGGMCSLTIVGLAQSSQMPSESLELTRFAKTVTNSISTFTFEVSPLSTGFSAQVTGFLKVICNPRKLSNEKLVDLAFVRNYHFKLDNNIVRATAL